MARLLLMLAAMACFLLAPAVAQDGNAGSTGGSAAESTDSGGMGDDGAAGDAGSDTATGDDTTGDDAAAGDDGTAGDDATAGDDDDAGDAGAAGDDGAAADDAMGDDAMGDDDGEDGEVAGGGQAGTDTGWSFAALDKDGDGALTQGEFGDGLYQMVVADDASGLGPDQYQSIVSQLGMEDTAVEFEQADVNGDDVVTDGQEFVPAVGIPLFAEWDSDTSDTLSSQEFRTGMFALVDANGNGTVDASEYEPFAGWFGNQFQEVAGGGGGLTPETFFPEEGEGGAVESAPAGDGDDTEEDGATDAEDGDGATDDTDGAENGDDADGAANTDTDTDAANDTGTDETADDAGTDDTNTDDTNTNDEEDGTEDQ